MEIDRWQLGPRNANAEPVEWKGVSTITSATTSAPWWIVGLKDHETHHQPECCHGPLRRNRDVLESSEHTAEVESFSTVRTKKRVKQAAKQL
jgi:hypothetical protein